ncbi:MAG: AmmeMemoRadiSam system radical SAM enzyme [Candidatus Tectomicrobia bacterium]|uniref:AmmeMemoRadiSam system radical SAM enzyme n=1 Tax=Tectimicrobiota bacterium TaxID=2528274 RepID=A0A932CQP7_UNCTE|nr:AmmeMemoRadiSam system radical SAM enzyme [Candidatus Tectomicrobia bacterium]
MREALLYRQEGGGQVVCALCAHRCRIAEGKAGRCGVRVNRAGRLYSLADDRVVSAQIDPIEKKPLFHFLPGSRSLSIATVGCNFHCLNCQNHAISQWPREHPGEALPGQSLSPRQIVSLAQAQGCASISYTYTEPTVYFELALEVARLARQGGIANLFVTNGYMTAQALEEIHPYLDAANVDLKGFDDRRYRQLCGGSLQPVLDSIRRMRELGVWVEVTTLVIPGHNDSPEELREIARFLNGVGAEVPWHLSAFYPTYRLTDRPRTPVENLHQARRIGRDEGLRYVYVGNVPGDAGEDTYCYRCDTRLIDRWGFHIQQNLLQKGTCPTCEAKIDGVFYRDL